MKTALIFILLIVCFGLASSLDYEDMLADDCRHSGRVYNPQDGTCSKQTTTKE